MRSVRMIGLSGSMIWTLPTSGNGRRDARVKDYGHVIHRPGLFMTYLPDGKSVVECTICGWKGEPVDRHSCPELTQEQLHKRAEDFR